MLHLLSRVTLRLTEQHPVTEELSKALGKLLDQCITTLRGAECASRDLLQLCCTCTDPRPPGPHTSSKLFDLESASEGEALRQACRWSGVVEELWRVAMSLPFGSAWDALTCRILISRSLGCRDRISVDPREWARRELVLNLSP